MPRQESADISTYILQSMTLQTMRIDRAEKSIDQYKLIFTLFANRPACSIEQYSPRKIKIFF